MRQARPAVRSDLIVDEIGAELLVFDPTTHRAHSLNAAAAAVFLACDGRRTVEQIGAAVELDETAVELALAELGNALLLVPGTGLSQRISRRVVLRRMAQAGAMAAVAAPVVRSIVAPSAAMAGSVARGGPCTASSDCRAGSTCYSNSTCGSGTCTPQSSGPSSPCSAHPCCHGLVCREVSASGATYPFCEV